MLIINLNILINILIEISTHMLCRYIFNGLSLVHNNTLILIEHLLNARHCALKIPCQNSIRDLIGYSYHPCYINKGRGSNLPKADTRAHTLSHFIVHVVSFN